MSTFLIQSTEQNMQFAVKVLLVLYLCNIQGVTSTLWRESCHRVDANMVAFAFY